MQIEVRKAEMGKEKKRLKVCAYARVSTEASEQENSLENQVSHYTEMIQANPAYEFAGVYADFGISGFKESRPQFLKMMQDAKNGKIDLIITKSVSRFARNTAIVLKASRELKERNVGIFFELQNINTLTEAGELLLTILAAFAQAESESASESSKMAYLHRIENGEVVAYLERSYGYEKDENGEYRAKEPEASVIREIYDLVIQGVNCTNIAKVLNARNIQTVQGAEWTASTVFRIVENEIYKGDVLMQKTFIDGKRHQVQNRGEKAMYYAKDNHPPIVSEKNMGKSTAEAGRHEGRKSRTLCDSGIHGRKLSLHESYFLCKMWMAFEATGVQSWASAFLGLLRTEERDKKILYRHSHFG